MAPANGKILQEIIEGYRALLYQRYQYASIVQQIDLPSTIDEGTVDKIRNYFLEYIYPDIPQRAELNAAFENLDSYIKNPEKLLRTLMDSISLIFTHGVHLPKILNTGLKALNTFKVASGFESKLAEMAVRHEIDPPFDADKIKSLMAYLSKKEIESFIENTESLVFVLRDKPLMKHIKEILAFLIKRMKKKKTLYTEYEIKSIEIGKEMLTKGEAIFDQFTPEDQDKLIHLIIQLERDILKEIPLTD